MFLKVQVLASIKSLLEISWIFSITEKVFTISRTKINWLQSFNISLDSQNWFVLQMYYLHRISSENILSICYQGHCILEHTKGEFLLTKCFVTKVFGSHFLLSLVRAAEKESISPDCLWDTHFLGCHLEIMSRQWGSCCSPIQNDWNMKNNCVIKDIPSQLPITAI